MAAHEALGRQFLDRHLVEHHGWQENWLHDYDYDPSNGAINREHKFEHLLNTPAHSRDTVGRDVAYKIPVPHSHSPERIHFGDELNG